MKWAEQFLAPPVLLLASDADGQSLPISSITITHLLDSPDLSVPCQIALSFVAAY